MAEAAITVDRRKRTVTWTMSAGDARGLAEFIRWNVGHRDLAIQDADALEAAAAELEAPADTEMPGVRMVVVL